MPVFTAFTVPLVFFSAKSNGTSKNRGEGSTFKISFGFYSEGIFNRHVKNREIIIRNMIKVNKSRPRIKH